jgi:hypothetical protein
VLSLTRPSGASSGIAVGAALSGLDLQLGEGTAAGSSSRALESTEDVQYFGTGSQDPDIEFNPVIRGNRVKKSRRAGGEDDLTTSRGPMFERQDSQEDEIDSDPSYQESTAAKSRQPQDPALLSTSHTVKEGSCRSTRETRGIAPERLETDEIRPYGAHTYKRS